MRVLPLLLLLLAACGTETPFDPLAPSREDTAIQERLTGHVLFLQLDPATTVQWFLFDGRYRFEQVRDDSMMGWEEGNWWIRDNRLIFDRVEGELIRSDGTVIVSTEWRRPIPFELLAESLEAEDLQLRMTVSAGGVFIYRVVPMEALLIHSRFLVQSPLLAD